MRIIVYRRSLSYTSGAGQLIAVQVRALRDAGIATEIFCQRGALRFWLRSGLRAHRVNSELRFPMRGSADVMFVDHGMELSGAHIVFAHNLMSEARRFLDRPEIDAAAKRERQFFAELNSDAIVVANSHMVRDAIEAHFGLPQARLRVCYPGYRAAAFSNHQRADLRAQARRSLGISEDTPLVGFVTSGDLHKRGLGVFLDTAEIMLERLPDLRFLVVGSRMLPDWTRHHQLLSSGALMHRARSARPQQWMAALDVFLYPARFEEFGMVVLEACALGIPVITSRRVGAAELLSGSYAAWICDSPDPQQMADLATRLLADAAARARLSADGIAIAHGNDDARYARDSVSIVTASFESAA
jgi:glycosyltransferase involved in cell wall biosynthesis